MSLGRNAKQPGRSVLLRPRACRGVVEAELGGIPAIKWLLSFKWSFPIWGCSLLLVWPCFPSWANSEGHFLLGKGSPSSYKMIAVRWNKEETRRLKKKSHRQNVFMKVSEVYVKLKEVVGISRVCTAFGLPLFSMITVMRGNIYFAVTVYQVLY